MISFLDRTPWIAMCGASVCVCTGYVGILPVCTVCFLASSSVLSLVTVDDGSAAVL
jgi:hypothetical protein